VLRYGDLTARGIAGGRAGEKVEADQVTLKSEARARKRLRTAIVLCRNGQKDEAREQEVRVTVRRNSGVGY